MSMKGYMGWIQAFHSELPLHVQIYSAASGLECLHTCESASFLRIFTVGFEIDSILGSFSTVYSVLTARDKIIMEIVGG